MTHPREDGVIKYDRSCFVLGPPLPEDEYEPLEICRKHLHALGLIGVYPNGIGFGNLSLRRDYSTLYPPRGPQFLITGSQTGHLGALTGEHYARVLDFDIATMRVSSLGPVNASSETLTHAAIYLVNARIHAIAHVHHPALWRDGLETGLPATSPDLAYGTAEMAWGVANLARGKEEGLIVMKGHTDGAICFGHTLARVGALLEGRLRALSGPPGGLSGKNPTP